MLAMLPPLTSSPPQLWRVADQLGDPAHGLALDLGRGRRQRPRAHVRIDRRGEKIGQHPDRRRRRRDVAEEARMTVEQRVIEQQFRGLLEQRPGIRAVLGERALEIERLPDSRWRLVRLHRAARDRFEKGRDLIDQPMAERPECVAVHGERRLSLRCVHSVIPSNKSDSRSLPPFTVLNTR